MCVWLLKWGVRASYCSLCLKRGYASSESWPFSFSRDQGLLFSEFSEGGHNHSTYSCKSEDAYCVDDAIFATTNAMSSICTANGLILCLLRVFWSKDYTPMPILLLYTNANSTRSLFHCKDRRKLFLLFYLRKLFFAVVRASIMDQRKSRAPRRSAG